MMSPTALYVPGVAVFTSISVRFCNCRHRLAVLVRRHCAVGRRRRVRHRARIQVSLPDGVRRSTRDRCAGRQARRRRTALIRRLVVAHRERTRQRHVARVRHQVAVADDLVYRSVRPRRRRLHQRQRHILNRRHRLSVRVRRHCAVGRSRRVRHRARIQVRLPDGVRRSTGDRCTTARLVSAGQVTVALSSLTVNGPASVTLPAFVTR